MNSELLYSLESSPAPECLAAAPTFPADKAGAWLSAIIQSTLDGVVIVDATRTLVLINREAERLFGYSAKQLLGKPLDVLLPVRLQQEHRLQMDDLATRRIGRRVIRTRVVDLDGVRSSGDEFPMNVSLSRVTVQAQMFMVMIVRDATEQLAAEQKYTLASTTLRKWAVSSQKVTEVEKRRFSKELYDDLGQRLSVLKLDMDWLEKSLENHGDPAPPRVVQMQALLDSIILSTKSMASALRPPLLDDFGLLPALEWIAHNFHKKAAISCAVKRQGNPVPLDGAIESAVFRVVQEGLLNIQRHSQAAQAHIIIRYTDSLVDVMIEDDGIGMAPGSDKKAGCYGLISMQERIYILGGSISIQNIAPQGLAIHASIPIEAYPH